MLLSVGLKFVSRPSCRADGTRMYPIGSHAMEKRSGQVEWGSEFQKRPFSFPLYKTVFPQRLLSWALTFCSWQRWCCLHFTTKILTLGGVKWPASSWMLCLVGESPKLFKCCAPYSCMTSTLPMTQIALSHYLQWWGGRSQFEEKKNIPGQNLCHSECKFYPHTTKNLNTILL